MLELYAVMLSSTAMRHSELTNVCLQTFVQRVSNMAAFAMNLYCWQCVIEPQMDKVFWFVSMC